MKVEIGPGETLEIELEGTDGKFKIVWGETQFKIASDLPDSYGRSGVIYSELFRMSENTPDQKG